MNRSEQIRKSIGLSRAAFSRKYDIPLRTLEDWDAGVSSPPAYVLNLLERAVLEDKRNEAFPSNWLGEVYIFPDGEWMVPAFEDGILTLENEDGFDPKKMTLDELARLFLDGSIKIK